MATTETTLTFYDIILDPKSYPGAPNPWKARYALNYAGVPYRTEWVPLRDVGTTRGKLNLPANRVHASGAPFPTLPILRDPSSGSEVMVGDSFDIALHLQHAHLSSSSGDKVLFPPRTTALTRAFNAHVDGLFSQHGAPLVGFNLPFDPATAEESKQELMNRMEIPAGTKWEDLNPAPAGSDARAKMIGELRRVLDAKLAGCFGEPGKVVGGLASESFGEWKGAGVTPGVNKAGPFLDGEITPVYSDFIVGGWLQFMRQGLSDEEWNELRNVWSDGKWGKLFDALRQWEHVDGREGVEPKRR